jgi:hypothetical protein
MAIVTARDALRVVGLSDQIADLRAVLKHSAPWICRPPHPIAGILPPRPLRICTRSAVPDWKSAAPSDRVGSSVGKLSIAASQNYVVLSRLACSLDGAALECLD